MKLFKMKVTSVHETETDFYVELEDRTGASSHQTGFLNISIPKRDIFPTEDVRNVVPQVGQFFEVTIALTPKE